MAENYLAKFARLVKSDPGYKRAKRAADKADAKKSAAYKKAVSRAKKKMKSKTKKRK